jgi:hypothetical protein
MAFSVWFSTVLIDAFRFIKRYRERQQAALDYASSERAKEREHQRVLIASVADRFLDVIRANQEGLLKIAEASNAQAAVFQTWIDGFKPTSMEPVASHTVTEEDEWNREQAHEQEVLAQLSHHPEFALALTLNKLDSSQDPNPVFDREGRDIF